MVWSKAQKTFALIIIHVKGRSKVFLQNWFSEKNHMMHKHNLIFHPDIIVVALFEILKGMRERIRVVLDHRFSLWLVIHWTGHSFTRASSNDGIYGHHKILHQVKE